MTLAPEQLGRGHGRACQPRGLRQAERPERRAEAPAL